MPSSDARYVSRLTKDTLALILAGGRGSRLHELTNWRAKPALYFGGKYRLIDFPLSNCINSGIRRVGILTQYKSHSLVRHVMHGWSHFKKELNEYVEILPASQRFSNDWYQGTADAVYQNIDIIRAEMPKYVLILSGDHIYKMDYGAMLVAHVESGAKMTVSCLEVPVEEAANAFGVLKVDANHRVTGFEEKPAKPSPLPNDPSLTLASMGNYIFDTDFLFDELLAAVKQGGGSHDFGMDYLPGMVRDHHVQAYAFRDPETGERAYWRDVGTLDSFWEANMELMVPHPPLDLYDPEWPIWTYQAQFPPARFVFDDGDHLGTVQNAMVAGGCLVAGADLKQTLLFSGVTVQNHSQIEQSVILPAVTIGRHCRIRKAIIDRGCHIPDGSIIGYDSEQDRRNGFRVTDKGVVLVTRGMLGQSEGFA